MHKFYLDIEKYKKYSRNKSVFILIITNQGLWALFVYRLASAVYNSKQPKILKRILLFFAVVWQKWIEIITGISLPYSSQIGPGFYIGHFGNIIINASATIGSNCNISQGVTIGISGKGENRGVPLIRNNVYIGANAVVVGKITVGDNCVIAANSLVTTSVEANKTVMGVPAIVVSNNNSKDYI